MNITVSFLLWLGVQLGVAPQMCGALGAEEQPVCVAASVHDPDEATGSDDTTDDEGMPRTVASAVLISNGF